jgi:hypothetical protein
MFTPAFAKVDTIGAAQCDHFGQGLVDHNKQMSKETFWAVF